MVVHVWRPVGMFDGHANQDEGDSPPAQWMPPNTAFACQYAMQFIAVLRQAAATCPAA